MPSDLGVRLITYLLQPLRLALGWNMKSSRTFWQYELFFWLYNCDFKNLDFFNSLLCKMYPKPKAHIQKSANLKLSVYLHNSRFIGKLTKKGLSLFWNKLYLLWLKEGLVPSSFTQILTRSLFFNLWSYFLCLQLKYSINHWYENKYVSNNSSAYLLTFTAF